MLYLQRICLGTSIPHRETQTIKNGSTVAVCEQTKCPVGLKEPNLIHEFDEEACSELKRPGPSLLAIRGRGGEFG